MVITREKSLIYYTFLRKQKCQFNLENLDFLINYNGNFLLIIYIFILNLKEGKGDDKLFINICQFWGPNCFFATSIAFATKFLKRTYDMGPRYLKQHVQELFRNYWRQLNTRVLIQSEYSEIQSEPNLFVITSTKSEKECLIDV